MFSAARTKRSYGLPGLLSLRLDSSLGHLFRNDDVPTRIGELTVPYECVVAGVRKAAFDKLPRRFRATAASMMQRLLGEAAARENVSAFIDGGVASNVPAEQAWRRVQAGKLGTRNAFVLVWDCFHPQWDPRHLWLQPITQAVALQQVRNTPFADWIVKFSPTLSRIDLVPAPERFDNALTWGEASMEPIIPMLAKLLEPVAWED